MISTTWWKYCGIEMLIWIPPRRHSLFHVVFFIFFIRSIFLPEVPKEACYFSQFLPHASYMGFTDNPAKPWQRQTDRRQRRGGAIFYIKDTTTHLTKFYNKVYNTHYPCILETSLSFQGLASLARHFEIVFANAIPSSCNMI